MMREVHVEQLIGRQVLDANGESIGHLEEVRAEEKNGELLVEEFHTGVRATAERLAGAAMIVRLARVVLRRQGVSYVIPWQQMDLSDPEHPRATVSRSELKPLK